MTDLQLVRQLAQDVPQQVTTTVDVEEGSTVMQLENYPVQATSVMLTGDTLPDYTVSADTGLVTFVTAAGAQSVAVQYTWTLLSDEFITALLALNVDLPDPIRLSAADALDAIAVNETLILRKIRILDLQTDGPAVADALRKASKNLRDLVYSQDYAESDFDTVEVGCVDYWGLRYRSVDLV